jgi:IS30 family transposase
LAEASQRLAASSHETGRKTYNRYSAHSAQRRASTLKKRCGRKHLLTNGTLRRYIIEQLLKEHWSPEIIARAVSKHLTGEHVSYETIYRYIYSAPKGVRKNLIGLLLPSHHIRRHRGYSRKHTKTHIPHRVLIKERPESINNRLDFDHWEAYTIVSRKSTAAIGVCMDRKSRYLAFDKLRTKSARRMSRSYSILIWHPGEYAPVYYLMIMAQRIPNIHVSING